jgi:two-component system phosphate regulon sensor histidine kinase PhoR
LADDLEARARILENQFITLLEAGDLHGVERAAEAAGKGAKTRVTVILPGGDVVGDSDEDIHKMDNHADRPEILEALRSGVGMATRYSRTLDCDMMYVGIALRSDNKLLGVLRTAVPVIPIHAALGQVTLHMAFGGLLIAVMAAALSLWVSRRLARPLEIMTQGAERFAAGDLAHRLPETGSEETAAVAAAMNRMGEQLNERMKAVIRRRNQLEGVLSSMVEGVIAVDTDGRVIRINEAAADLLGYPSERARGRSIYEIARYPGLGAFVKEALKAEDLVERDLVIYAGEEERTIQAHGTCLKDETGSRWGALIVLNDLTRLRRLEDLRRDFVANVSHEIKTPLTAIKGFVETLREDPEQGLSETAARFMEIIHDHLDRLENLLEDLLSLSRIEEAEHSPGIRLEPGDPASVAAAAIELVKDNHPEEGVDIRLECDQAPAIPLNPVLLEQAFVNLLENAVKYGGPGGEVRVEVENLGGEIAVRFHDHGPGIPAEHLPRIFERFYRVDRSRSRKLGGTGLGLAIVKHVVQAHHGRVEVESIVGEGSTFTVYLPAAGLGGGEGAS